MKKLFIIIILLASTIWSFAQDTIPKYAVKVTRKQVIDKVFVWYYKPIGKNETHAPILITSGGGGGTRYIPTDSINFQLASCGYPNFQISYKPHSISDVLFNTEKVLFDNTNDILLGRQWILTHQSTFGYPDTATTYFLGLSWGAMVGLYLSYHTDIADKLVSYWGATLKLNMINKNVPTLLIHGTADKILPYNEGYAYGNNFLIGNIVYVYGSKKINEWSLDRGYDSELVTLNGYGHGATKTGTDTKKTMKILNNKSLTFLYH